MFNLFRKKKVQKIIASSKRAGELQLDTLSIMKTSIGKKQLNAAEKITMTTKPQA